MIETVSLVQLEYVVAIDTWGSFGEAAEKCFVTQPTLSMQVKKLEESLGIIVFDRSKKPVVATDAGKAVIEQARVVLGEMQRMQELVRQEKQEIKGEIRIGIIPTLSSFLVPEVLANIPDAYPGMEIEVNEMVTGEIVEALKKDILDLGILVTPLKEREVKEEALFYEEILVYVSREHVLFQQDAVRQEDLEGDDIWLLSKGHCFRNQMVNLCGLGDAGKTTAFRFESGSMETMMRLVDARGGYTLLPELALRGLSKPALRQVKPIAPAKPVREVSLVFTRRFAKRSMMNIIKKQIREALPPGMLDPQRGNLVEWR